MRTAYSLLVDEYVDASLAEPIDCEALHICCPLCQEPVVLEAESGAKCFRHAAPLIPSFEAECESLSSEFVAKYCGQHNARARRRRLEFLRGNLFDLLLGNDPLGPYRDSERIWEETPKLLFMGVLSSISHWHWRHIMCRLRNPLIDPVEFFAAAERHLRSTRGKLPDVPESGLCRQVHFQIAFDLMQSLVAREDSGEDYDWLFVHAFRICLGNWVRLSETGQKAQTQLETPGEEVLEHAAVASILGSSALRLLSNDQKDVHDAIEALTKVETELPTTEDKMPVALLFGIEIAGVMQSTLCRLPYLPLLGQYDRPCRPLVV